jgi:hypothetical protein
LINFLQIYFIFARIFARFCKFQKLLRKKGRKNRLKEGADVNEGKFVLNIDFIIALHFKANCMDFFKNKIFMTLNIYDFVW